jgi:methyl coenzyme M reductase subunit C-like uncharacterized protein (methanogenesis marker protein 7)
MNQININNIAIPIYEIDPEKIEAPDLEPSINYYPNFIRHSKKKDRISPAEYLNKIVSIVCKDGEHRTQLLMDFAKWEIGFVGKMEAYHNLYKSLV